MTTRKPAAATSQPRQSEAEVPPLAPATKLVLSGLILLHLAAVFWAPFAFACNVGPSSSPLADPVARWLHPYLAAMYLEHGYFFFAPDPGPSHLVRYRIEFDDGREPLVGTFPDLATERPRLLYHRHFMLSESLFNRFTPPDPPPEPTPPPLTASAAEKAAFQRVRDAYARDLAAWQHQRRQYEALWRSFEEHLLHEHGGSKVTLTRVEHRLPAPDEVRVERRSLRAADSYLDLPETASPENRR
jgi:hypothetical protein